MSFTISLAGVKISKIMIIHCTAYKPYHGWQIFRKLSDGTFHNYHTNTSASIEHWIDNRGWEMWSPEFENQDDLFTYTRKQDFKKNFWPAVLLGGFILFMWIFLDWFSRQYGGGPIIGS